MRVLLLSALLLGACGDDDSDSDTETGFCAEAPTVTWASFGDGFVRERCQTCHASTTVDRQGAPEAITFDTHEQASSLAPTVLDRILDEGEDKMPPRGGLSEDELAKAEIWLRCEEGVGEE